MTVYGTRPEAIKVAPVLRQLAKSPNFESIAVSTGQHREMLDQVNQMFKIVPEFDLNIMRPAQSLNMIFSRTVSGIDGIISATAPDAILVQGDTTTAAAAAIAAFNSQVPVVHLEAGLRTGDITEPFPEEGNRKIVGQISKLHLAPTAASKENLISEGVCSEDIVISGNTVIDALFIAKNWKVRFTDERLEAVRRAGSKIVMVTTHRRENIQDMKNIGRAIARLAKDFSDVVFVLPAHLNPKVREKLLPWIVRFNNVLVTEPLPYNEFTQLMTRSTLILSDSGGVQEEAPSLGKPVLVLRKNTERPEAVLAGTVKLIGTNEDSIVREARRLLTDKEAYNTMANAVNPYGDGNAAIRCVRALGSMFGIDERMADYCPL
ncbi:UDP-N-acetylglucosamine 2-epimerase (non-hydrolyzing) [Corynebacterium sp. CCM 9186]|nr:UDP-N-acetylglucosamine 2-epimerase (non-hydrolyzing) [Corynebacterium meridianum]